MRWNKRVSNYPDSLWDQSVNKRANSGPTKNRTFNKQTTFLKAMDIITLRTPGDSYSYSSTTLPIHRISYTFSSYPPEHLSTFSTIFHINFFRQLPFQLYSTMNHQPGNDDSEQDYDPQESSEKVIRTMILKRMAKILLRMFILTALMRMNSSGC